MMKGFICRMPDDVHEKLRDLVMSWMIIARNNQSQSYRKLLKTRTLKRHEKANRI
jgi:hypothetical protein